jgi:hypothetical protein
MRVVFVGQRSYFAACSLEQPIRDIEPAFVDFRYGDDPDRMLADLRELRPHVAVFFRPEHVPAGALGGVAALRLGFLTEPLPRAGDEPAHDLERRLSYLEAADPANFDRIVSFDPLIAETVRPLMPVWRSTTLPVADRFFREPLRRPDPAPPVFVGRSTDHREKFLMPLKHSYDLLHIAHGVEGDELERALDGAFLSVNLHSEPYRSFENRVCVALAAGHLVVTEPLDPTHGLEPFVDYLEVHHPGQLLGVVGHALREPDAYWPVRVAGRMKAERYRASLAWPRLVHDLVRDVRVFGRPAQAAAASSARRSNSARTN